MVSQKDPEFVAVHVGSGMLSERIGQEPTIRFFVNMVFDDRSTFLIFTAPHHNEALSEAFDAADGRPVVDSTGRAH